MNGSAFGSSYFTQILAYVVSFKFNLTASKLTSISSRVNGLTFNEVTRSINALAGNEDNFLINGVHHWSLQVQHS